MAAQSQRRLTPGAREGLVNMSGVVVELSGVWNGLDSTIALAIVVLRGSGVCAVCGLTSFCSTQKVRGSKVPLCPFFFRACAALFFHIPTAY